MEPIILNQQEVSTLEGDELAGIRNKEIGFVFQNFHLLARNSALDNVMLPLKYAGVDKEDQLKELGCFNLKWAGIKNGSSAIRAIRRATTKSCHS